MKTRHITVMIVLVLPLLVVSACGSKAPTPTQVDVTAVAANAISTFVMQMTQTAFARPTATWTPFPTVTDTLVATLPFISSTNTSTVPSAISCDKSKWISDVTIPDSTIMLPGQQFVKTWLYENTGTCTWMPSYRVAFGGIGLLMGGQTTQIGKTVKPGEQVEISVAFVAPTSVGDYESYWKLINDKGEFFGDWLWVKIKVRGATATATEEPSPTPTSTSTP